MVTEMSNVKNLELKGVIPPRVTDSEEQLKVLRDVQEFLKWFPGLGEESMRERERQRQYRGDSVNYRRHVCENMNYTTQEVPEMTHKKLS